MKAIVFSRDRPMQLDLLLTSLERNASGIFEPHVIYHAKRDEFKRGYEICASEHPEATFIREDGLTYQVRHLVKQGRNGLLTFFTDDDVIYRSIYMPPLDDARILAFSLRLGRNTTVCYPHDSRQTPPEFPHFTELIWGWQGADGDFGYPMSLDGHIFRASDIEPLIRGRNFSSPNWLEEILMQSVNGTRPLMASYRQSALVGIPVNVVSETHSNRAGVHHAFSVQDLNERYLRGERIDLDALDFSDIRGAHQELELIFG